MTVKIDQQEFGTATAPAEMETTGLGPCIGVAIVYRQRGFILHAAHVIIEREHLTDPFFRLLDTHIPPAERSTIAPVVAGGCLESYGTDEDEELQEDTRECRRHIVERLAGAGFAEPRVRWGEPDDIHSIFLDLHKQVATLEIIDLRVPENSPRFEKFTF